MKQLFILLFALTPILLFSQESKTTTMIEEKWKEVDRLISIGNYEQTAPLLNEIKTYAKKI